MSTKSWLVENRTSDSLFLSLLAIGLEFVILGISSLLVGGVTALPVYLVIEYTRFSIPSQPTGPVVIWLFFSVLVFRFMKQRDPVSAE